MYNLNRWGLNDADTQLRSFLSDRFTLFGVKVMRHSKLYAFASHYIFLSLFSVSLTHKLYQFLSLRVPCMSSTSYFHGKILLGYLWHITYLWVFCWYLLFALLQCQFTKLAHTVRCQACWHRFLFTVYR